MIFEIAMLSLGLLLCAMWHSFKEHWKERQEDKEVEECRKNRSLPFF